MPALAAVVIGWGSVGIVFGRALRGPARPCSRRRPSQRRPRWRVGLTWRLAWGEAVLFGAYGLAQHDAGLTTLAGFGLVASTLILVRLARTRTPVRGKLAERIEERLVASVAPAPERDALGRPHRG